MPPLNDELLQRADHACELCSGTADLRAVHVAPHNDDITEHLIATCGTCADQMDGNDELEPRHWFSLQGSIWSEVPAVQVVSWRMLQRLRGEPWAAELLDQAYLDEATMEWARAVDEMAGGDAEERRTPTVDSVGNTLADGDSVTLIKDLDVKGANFTAKRGTLVRGIRLTDNPEHVEGKVNRVQIVLVAAFLKKAN